MRKRWTLLDTPPRPKTGEVFVMRPTDRLLGIPISNNSWRALAATIEHLGGEVVVLKPKSRRFSEWRNAMYVRDPGIALPLSDAPRAPYFGPRDGGASNNHAYTKELAKEWQCIAAGLEHGVENVPLPGLFEGGNAVYDARRGFLFLGVSNRMHLDRMALWHEGGKEETREGKILRIARAAPYARGAQEIQSYLDEAFRQARIGRRIRVVPMFVPDEHCEEYYHLDGCMNMLPSGEAVVCRPLLSRSANMALDKLVGVENLIAIEPWEAQNGATNFITVGNTVITPYASGHLRERMELLGYDIVQPPDVGLASSDWLFANMASVRCATLKITPDKGYPEPGREAARVTGRAK